MSLPKRLMMMPVLILHSGLFQGLATRTAFKHLIQLMVSMDQRPLSTTLGCPLAYRPANGWNGCLPPSNTAAAPSYRNSLPYSRISKGFHSMPYLGSEWNSCEK